MLEKIKAMKWQQWGIVGISALLIVMLPSLLESLMDGTVSKGSGINWSPWHNAMEVSRDISIKEFGSETGTGASVSTGWNSIMSMIGVLLFMVVGPGLLILYGYGNSKSEEKGTVSESIEQDKEEDTDTVENQPTIPNGFLIGLIITLAAFINLGAEYAVYTYVSEGSKESAHMSRQKDLMRGDMISLGFAAYEYYALPDSLDGGAGNFRGIQVQDALSKIDVDDGLDLAADHYTFTVKADTHVVISGHKIISQDTRSDTLDLKMSITPKEMITWQ